MFQPSFPRRDRVNRTAMRGIEHFDGDFFGVSEAELRAMDPHQHLGWLDGRLADNVGLESLGRMDMEMMAK